jgi:hypothetical protein
VHVERRVVDLLAEQLDERVPNAGLRHTYASLLIAANVQPMVVAAQLGHTDARLVLQRYGHLLPGVAAQAAMALDLYLRAAVAMFVFRDPSPSVGPNSLVRLDVETLQPVDVLNVGEAPTTVVAGDDAAWVLDAEDRTVTRVSATSKELRTVAVGLSLTSLAVSPEAVWVSDDSTGAVANVDPRTLIVEYTIEQPELGDTNQAAIFGQVALVDNSLWVANRDRTLTKIDAAQGDVLFRRRIGGTGTEPKCHRCGSDRSVGGRLCARLPRQSEDWSPCGEG